MAETTEFGQLSDLTLCMLGCGNLGRAILESLVSPSAQNASAALPISRYRICVRTEATEKRLQESFHTSGDQVVVSRGDNISAIEKSDIIILAVDPADVATTLQQQGVAQALSRNDGGTKTKLLISVAAGWSRRDLEKAVYGSATNAGNESHSSRAWILRTLPNVGAAVSQSLTAIEISEPALPKWSIDLADAIFSRVGKAVQIPPTLMDAATAVGGSTPAFWATLCDAMIDAAVAVGVPRPLAHTMIFQSMIGTATMMQKGLHPALLKDQGTSPEGCTIGGLMVIEETAVRGNLGRALREAVTIARQMGKNPHPNDTRNMDL